MKNDKLSVMKPDIKWLFFDTGSTLVDETLCYEKRYKEITAGTSVSCEEFREKVIAFSRMNLKGDHQAAKEYGFTIPKWHKESERLYPDVCFVLETLKARGYRLGVIANQSLGTDERLKQYGILSYFDVIVASAEEGVSKPDRRIFELALERADCLPCEAVMIGDRLDNDIVPANAIGMKSVWIKQGLGQYYVVRSVEEKPDVTIDTLDKLLEIFS